MYDVPAQLGRTFIVTGANSGIGKEATARLSAAGARVIMAVRTVDKGEDAQREILARVPNADLSVRRIDLADQSSVHEFARGIVKEGIPVDVLVNNAGVMMPKRRFETVDGFELQFASNFLDPFALTNLLLPHILASPAPRVVMMSSILAVPGRIRFDDLQWVKRYSPMLSYAQSKLADLLMGRHLATVAVNRGWPLISTIAHPGYTRTNLQSAGANLGRTRTPKAPVQRTLTPSQDVAHGAEPLLFAATSADAEQGAYYGPGGLLSLVGPTKTSPFPRSARSASLAAELWTRAEQLTGTGLPAAGHP